IPERHLGLTTAEESPFDSRFYDTIRGTLSKTIDIDRLLSIATVDRDIETSKRGKKHLSTIPLSNKKLRVALAYDRAFSFYYPENLNLLKSAGAEIVTFSPLDDKSLPEADLVYLGGGYPELYAEGLSGNRDLLSTLCRLASEGLPIYAECGGLIYISEGIYDTQGRYFPMAGILPFVMRMRQRRAYLGYREVMLEDDVFFGKKHTRYRGHEFHYSEIVEEANAEKLKNRGIKTIYRIFDKENVFVKIEGYRYQNTIGSYVHLHFGSNPEEFIRAIDKFFHL
ncbi:MAG: cobyrinate a,c-diamide synthase, partial [Nitrospirae bacterium]|nr:cobyrinate a,c-diamide synthase [Nitrospirota bacterium]